MATQTKAPEAILLTILNNAINFLRQDYNNQSDKTKSYLAQITEGIVIERYDYFEQAKKVFIENDETDHRFLQIVMMYNAQVEKVPSIYISMPMENQQSGGNGIGLDEGYQENIIVESEYDTNDHLVTQGTITPQFTRRYQTTFNLVITSENTNEVCLIYHVLKSLLIALSPSIHLAGLENPIIGGGDVQLPKYFSKAITVNCQYETTVPNLFSQNILKNLTATGKPVLS